jgi:hypothetical protein
MIENSLIIAFFFFLFKLINNIGKSFPLFELTALLYLLQYGIAPMLEYAYGVRGSMAVPQSLYLNFAVWCSFSFIAGLLLFQPKIKLQNIVVSSEVASKLGRLFIVIAMVSTILMSILPPAIHSIITFFIILKGPGIFSLIFSDKKTDKIIIAIVYFEIAFSAILNALLIEFIVFTIFISIFFSLRYKVTASIKYTIVIFGIIFLSIYQGVKSDYRELVWEGEVSFQEKIGLLSELITWSSIKEGFNPNLEQNESANETIHRLNQGWQTSMALDHVPRVVPFENGKAILEDILSAIMPRVLMPNKRVVNDHERFNYYTGYNLNEKTSMTIGVLGDFYINFGFSGSIIMLFLLGLFLSFIAKWFYNRFIYSNPINLIWLPFIFSYLIRPGNEFYMVFNHIIKALIIFYIIRKFLYPYLYGKLEQAS